MTQEYEVPVESILRHLVAHPPKGVRVELRKKNVVEVTDTKKNKTVRTRRLAVRKAVESWCEATAQKPFSPEGRVARAGREGRWPDFLAYASDATYRRILTEALKK